MAIASKVTKFITSSLLRNIGNQTTKCAGKVKITPRLFSVKNSTAVGTEIRNNITGTRYLKGAGVSGKSIMVEPMTTVRYADGTVSSIETTKFEKLLARLKHENPVLKSNPIIGKEVVLKNGRYFRSNSEIDKELIKQTTAEKHSSMTLKDFDKMLLNLFG
jgi:hypothetical protein